MNSVSGRDSSTFSTSVQPVELFGLLYRRWRWIVSGLMVGVAAAVAYCLLGTDLYEASVQILVMKKDSNLPTQAIDAASGAIDSKAADDLLATHIQIFSSPRVVQHALETHNLGSLPSLKTVMSSDDDPVRYIIDNLVVKRGGKGQAQTAHVLTATVTYPSAEDSAAILSAILEAYQHFVGERFQDAGLEAVGLITQAKDELTEKLQTKEAAYVQFREQTPMLWSGETSVNVHQVRLVDIEKSLVQNRLRYAQVKSRLGIVENAIQSSSSDVSTGLQRAALIDSEDTDRLSLLISVERGGPVSEAFRALQPTRAETASTEHDRLLALRLEAKNLQLDKGPNHPKVIEANQSIKELEDFLANQAALLDSVDGEGLNPGELIEAYSQLLYHDRIELERRLDELEELAETERKAAKQLVSYELRGNSLRRDVERTQALYDTVVDRLREINLIKDYGGFMTEVISPVEEGRRTWPSWPLTLALGGLAGILVGSVMALGRECTDHSFHNLTDVQDTLRLRLLGNLPELQRACKRVALDAPEGGRLQVHPLVVTYHQPQSDETEAFRSLRESIGFGADSRLCRVIQVASPTAGEGTTALAANLAVSMAAAGKRVLLVDCNLRCPRVHELFGVESAAGLSTHLRGDAAVSDVVSITACEGLQVLPSGPVPDDGNELLARPCFDDFIRGVRDAYDIVLLDSPQLLSVSDALSLAARVDGVILHTRLSHNGRQRALAVRAKLDELPTPILGVVTREV